tara:strand:- start:69 stop:497 length:429 start_codon:yes stop_codon:yes gene_type:complete
MGVEADIRSLSEDDRSTLEAAINLHKQHRHLIHSGRYVEHEQNAQQVAWSVVSEEQGEALSAVAMLRTPTTAFPKRIRFRGLDASKQYQVQVIWPQDLSEKQASYRDQLKSQRFGGDWLEQAGLTLPIMHPESLLIFHLIEA